MYKSFLSLFLVILLCGCSGNENNSDMVATSSIDKESTITTKPSSDSTAKIKTNSDEYEAIEGNEPQTKFYYNKLYENYVTSSIYSGALNDFDYQILDGYKFIGIVSYRSENAWEDINTNFGTNFFEEGDAVLYSEEKDNFYL